MIGLDIALGMIIVAISIPIALFLGVLTYLAIFFGILAISDFFSKKD